MIELEILMAALAKIEKPENWCQNAYARNAAGEAVSEYDPSAVSFCAVGALNLAVRWHSKGQSQAVNNVYRWLILASNSQQLLNFNDSASHSDVLKIFRRAIKAAETIPNS